MARTALTVTELTENTATADLGTWEDADTVNGDVIEDTEARKLVILMDNPGASSATVTVAQANRNPEQYGVDGGSGDLVVTLAAGELMALMVESARFVQAVAEETGEVAGIYLDAGGTGAADINYRVIKTP